MKKATYFIYIMIFFSICLAPLVGRMAGYINVDAEKRELASCPSLLTENGINMSFTDEFDAYFTDNFAFRTDFITAYAKLYDAVFQQSISDQVIIGKEGWLFFTPEVKDYTNTEVLSDGEVYRISRTLEIMREYAAMKGADFIFAIAPNKSSIYGEYMPDAYIQVGDQNSYDVLAAELTARDFPFVDLRTVLRNGSEEADLYHKKDTHWNNLGARLGYVAIMDAVSESVPGFAFDSYEGITPVATNTWSGDLEGMLFPTQVVLDTQYDFGIEENYRSRRPIKSPEEIKITTYCDSGEINAVMYRDSFANALIPMMSNAFSTITYSRAIPYDFSLVTEETDVVIFEIVERNLRNILLQAPKMPAYEVDLSEQSLTCDEMDIETVTSVDGTYFDLAGIAQPSDYDSNTNYDIYIRLVSDEATYTFVSFPILEDVGLCDDPNLENAAFSLRIDTEALMPGDYHLCVVVDDGTLYCLSQIQEDVLVHVAD